MRSAHRSVFNQPLKVSISCSVSFHFNSFNRQKLIQLNLNIEWGLKILKPLMKMHLFWKFYFFTTNYNVGITIWVKIKNNFRMCFTFTSSSIWSGWAPRVFVKPDDHVQQLVLHWKPEHRIICANSLIIINVFISLVTYKIVQDFKDFLSLRSKLLRKSVYFRISNSVINETAPLVTREWTARHNKLSMRN